MNNIHPGLINLYIFSGSLGYSFGEIRGIAIGLAIVSFLMFIVSVISESKSRDKNSKFIWY